MSARVYFMKRVKDCKDVSVTVCSQNIYKQNVNIADETLTDYSFLSLLGHLVYYVPVLFTNKK